MIKFGYIYKITLPNGKFYFGKKESSKVLDYYWGSGRYIKDWFKKHFNKKSCDCPSSIVKGSGIKREIIFWAGNRECLKTMEKIVIGNLWKNNKNCVNMCEGGTFGGAVKSTEQSRKKQSLALKGKKKSREHIESVRKAITGNVKLKQKAKEEWSKPGFKEKMSEIHKKIWAERKASKK